MVSHPTFVFVQSFIAICSFAVTSISLNSQYAVEESICRKSSLKYFNFKNYTCCNNGFLQNVKEFRPWERATERPANTMEILTTSMWSVYSQYIADELGGDSIITLSKFANMWGKYYPESIRAVLNSAIEEAGKEKPTWLSATLTDYDNLNRIRTAYFDMEKRACGVELSSKRGYNDKSIWNHSCSARALNGVVHEMNDFCCRGTTLPFRVLAEYQSFDVWGSSCTDTIERLSHELNVTDEAGVTTLVAFCRESCILIEKNGTSVEEILKTDNSTVINTGPLVESFAPFYMSKSIVEYTQDYVRVKFNVDSLTTAGSPPIDEVPFGCSVHREILNLFSDSIEQYCGFPPWIPVDK